MIKNDKKWAKINKTVKFLIKNVIKEQKVKNQ